MKGQDMMRRFFGKAALAAVVVWHQAVAALMLLAQVLGVLVAMEI